MGKLILSGQVVTGQGQGAGFTQLDWVREQFTVKLGIDAYPGTLNLSLSQPSDLALWAELKASADTLIIPPTPAWCQARAYPVRLAGRLPGAIIVPEVPGYPETQVEIIAALPVRQELTLTDGDDLAVEINQPLPVEAVIFDADGTLVDTLEAFRVVAELVAMPHGFAISAEVVRYALNNNYSAFWDLVVPADRTDRIELMEMMKQESLRRWPDVLQLHSRVMPGLRETLEILQSRGIRLGIVTGSRGGSLQLMRAVGLLDFFEVIITAVDVSQNKPHPEGLLKCAAALGVEPDQAVYIGDTPVDIQASRAAGMAAVAVLSGAGDSALLSAARPDWLIYSHASLAKIIKSQ